MTEHRPDPDQLLRQMHAGQARQSRGRLKIYVGAFAGVGKTYAMLAAAHRLRQDGHDVVCGVIETHGRKETVALLEGLETLPLRPAPGSQRWLAQFDLDAALAKAPEILLVDELACSNAPGGLHPKRWQDVEDLLRAGIDVHTTLNVQHLESVSDIVASISGITVRETLPDRIFQQADEVVLIDLPPQELRLRLKQGRIYLPDQADRAARHFFRLGNLLALRELALRLTAERVDHDRRRYHDDLAQTPSGQVSEALLLCVGPHTSLETVRATARLARTWQARWHAVHVETPAVARQHASQRATILSVLELARCLGAETAVLHGQRPAGPLADYARRHQLNRVVLGRALDAKRLRGPPFWHASLSRQLARTAPELDQILIAADIPGRHPNTAREHAWPRVARADGAAYAGTVSISVLTSAIGALLAGHLASSNIVMLFLLAVVFIAWRWGRGPAVLAALVNVLAFDFFCVPPRLSFAVSDIQYVFTFAVMLGVGLLIGQLTANLRFQAKMASLREQRTHALYELSRELAGALTVEQVADLSRHHIERSLHVHTTFYVMDEQDQLQRVGDDNPIDRPVDLELVRRCHTHAEAVGAGTATLPASAALYVPLTAPMRCRGVVVIHPAGSAMMQTPEQRRLLDTCTAQIAVALERIHFVSVAQDTLLAIEAERLRNSVLSALSHDLRTPLTSLIGAADILRMRLSSHDAMAHDQAIEIARQARRLGRMVNDLLELARLQSGRVSLKRDWQSLEELIGASLRELGQDLLHAHPLSLQLPDDLPLFQGDAVLLQRVFFNLLDNAFKHTPPGTDVEVLARAQGASLRITVRDTGPGLPPNQEAKLFETFTRGETESTTPGMGLGLAICRAIVHAHGGAITAANRPTGGAVFSLTLPLDPTPIMEAFTPGADDA